MNQCFYCEKNKSIDSISSTDNSNESCQIGFILSLMTLHAYLTSCIKYRIEASLGVSHQHRLWDFLIAPGITVLSPIMCPCPHTYNPLALIYTLYEYIPQSLTIILRPLLILRWHFEFERSVSCMNNSDNPQSNTKIEFCH